MTIREYKAAYLHSKYAGKNNKPAINWLRALVDDDSDVEDIREFIDIINEGIETH